MLLLHEGLNDTKSREAKFQTLIKNLHDIYDTNDDAKKLVDGWTEK